MSREKVEALLADPEFDVEHFLHNVNLHMGRPDIIGTLVADPTIALSIAEGPEWKILERFPPASKDFLRMQELGLEAWTKETEHKYNKWHGIVANEELAISYRLVNEREVKVYKGKNAAKNARARWKELKMHKVGEEPKNRPLQPGERPIDYIRAALKSKMEKTALSNASYRGGCPTESGFEYSYGNWQNRQYLSFAVQARGPYKVEVKIWHIPPGSSRWSNSTTEEKEVLSIRVDKKSKETLPPEECANLIFKWLLKRSKLLQRHSKNAV